MNFVYVISKDGKPLMPTTRGGHVRHLLHENKARVVERIPFTIQLLYETPDVTQPLILGIDPGRTNIGLAVVNEQGVSQFAATLVTRNKDVPSLMKDRKAHRTKHRQLKRRAKRRRRARKNHTTVAPVFKRKLPNEKKQIELHDIRNKKARFNNRVRPAGWLTPTANHLLQTHINAVKKIMKFLPITDVVMEENKFAFMAIDNPNIKPWDYQHGQLYGYGSVENAVSAQQGGHCIFCKNGIDHNHHIIPRSKRGSDTLPNIAGLCNKHHDLVHKSEAWKDKLAQKKAGLNKKYGALSVLNQIIKPLETALADMFPGYFYAVSGRDTKAYRDEFRIPKEHFYDAFCIAMQIMPNVKPRFRGMSAHRIRQFRRHDRQVCHQEMLNRNYLLNGKKVATNRHKAIEQKENSLEEYRDSLIQNVGIDAAKAILSNLAVEPHPPVNKDVNRALPGSLFIHKGRVFVLASTRGKTKGQPNYYVDVFDVRHYAKECIVIQNNTGLRFVS